MTLFDTSAELAHRPAQNPVRSGSPATGRSGSGIRRILWINERAADLGGCESYARTTAALLRGLGIESSLLYDPNLPTDPSFLEHFGSAFPAIDLQQQIADIDPDVVYVQRCEGRDALERLLASGRPVVRFYHDHQLFCLREHKYDPLRQRTCTRSTGLACYACPGFLTRGGTGRLRLRSLRTLRREQASNRRLAGWIVGSRYMRDHLIAHDFDGSRIHTVPLFAEEKEGAPSRAAGAVDAEGRPRPLLFVGQLARGKGLDLLLHAIGSMAVRPALRIVGDGPQGEECRELARQLGLGESVRFLGRKSGADLDALYRDSSAVVVPSRSPETFGLVGLEAMSHGVPTIAARVGGMVEWLHEGETGFGFESGNGRELAVRIETLLASPALRAEMGRAARERHRRHFLPDHHARRLVRALETTVTTHHRGIEATA
jgi:glycosyltransferase involved in cell wall biosynthesis